MAEHVTVAVRVRPFLPNEEAASCVAVSDNQISVGESRIFAFDRVFDSAAASGDVYAAVGQQLIDAFLSGFHTATIAYGQTGAGKTFTMAALLNDAVQELFCRLAEEGANVQAADCGSADAGDGTSGVAAAAAKSSSAAFSLTLSVVEVYNESVGDLLCARNLPTSSTAVSAMAAASRSDGDRENRWHGAISAKGRTKRGASLQPHSLRMERRPSPRRASVSSASMLSSSLSLREDPHGGVYVVGLTEVPVESVTGLLDLLDDALGNRKTASTLMNAVSSRSHCIATLTLHRHGCCARCCFVDLAGSERFKKSLGISNGPSRKNGVGSGGSNTGSPSDNYLLPDGTAATRMREGIHINSGLLALGNVIVALCERKTHVPYRSSKLTRLLQPMLSGNSRTAIIACVAPSSAFLEETLNTLKYANRAKQIPVNPQLAVETSLSQEESGRTIALLRDQLEDAQRRLVMEMEPFCSPSDSLAVEVQRISGLLQRERRLTKRLESDLFNAEYTTMIEVEKRKALESRVAFLETLTVAAGPEGGETSTPNTTTTDADSISAGLSPKYSSQRPTVTLTHRPQSGGEQDSRSRTTMPPMWDTDQPDVTPAGDRIDPLAAATATSDVASLEFLTLETAMEEGRMSQLQKEKNEFGLQLMQYERALEQTLHEQQQLQEELRRLETPLEKLELPKDKQERARQRTTHEERLRNTEDRAAAKRFCVRVAALLLKECQDDLLRACKRRSVIMELREEADRLRQRTLPAPNSSEFGGVFRSVAASPAKRRLGPESSPGWRRGQRFFPKDAAVAETHPFPGEQTVLQLATPTPSWFCKGVSPKLSSNSPADSSQNSSVGETPLGVIQPRRASSTAASMTTPPIKCTPVTTGVSHKEYKATSETCLGRRKVPPPLYRPHAAGEVRSPSGNRLSFPAEDATQASIEEELLKLERLESELAELQESRRTLSGAQITEKPKWSRAVEELTRRLTEVQRELKTSEADKKRRALLLKERDDVAWKLKQLQSFGHMFTDADQQLVEFDNRIESLNETRNFHLQCVRRLQRTAALIEDDGAEDESGALARVPSVRSIRTAGRKSATTLSRKRAPILKETSPLSLPMRSEKAARRREVPGLTAATLLSVESRT